MGSDSSRYRKLQKKGEETPPSVGAQLLPWLAFIVTGPSSGDLREAGCSLALLQFSMRRALLLGSNVSSSSINGLVSKNRLKTFPEINILAFIKVLTA